MVLPFHAQKRVRHQNAELFTLTYGALVRQVLHDCEDRVFEANKKLDEMGHAMGCRLIEDFLAKTNARKCLSFKESAETVALVGFKMFVNLECSFENWNYDETRSDAEVSSASPQQNRKIETASGGHAATAGSG